MLEENLAKVEREGSEKGEMTRFGVNTSLFACSKEK